MTDQDRQKYEQVVQDNQGRLLGFIRRRVGELEDAEDILQNVFYQLSKAAIILQPVEEINAWLYTVTRNQVIDFFRKKREEPLPTVRQADGGETEPDFVEALFMLPSATPEQEFVRTMFWQELDLALSELPPEQREVFEQTEILGYSFREISEESGVNQNTLLSRKRYAVQHLRRRLSELYSDLLDM